MSIFKRLTFAIALLASSLSLYAQKSGQTDSLVRLMNAKQVQLLQDDFGKSYRKAIDARFLHNDTYLICDTALWSVDDKVINCIGHVQILQDNTVLTSENLDYYVDLDLAQFRGSVVQLLDKDKNTLRTRCLDYNTKDSVAVFQRGASMRDKDGQIIESDDGEYDSKLGLFTFRNNVNMYTDSVFVKTEHLEYQSDSSLATFSSGIDAWKDRNMLSADGGWYDRAREVFLFIGNVHGMSTTQEVWTDSLYYYRTVNDVEMFGNAQVMDTTRNVNAVADHIFYQDSLSRVTLEKNAALAAETQGQQGGVDTVYVGADKVVYRTVKMCDVPEPVLKTAEGRIELMYQDPVTEYRKAALKAAREAAEAAALQDPTSAAYAAKVAAEKAAAEKEAAEKAAAEKLAAEKAAAEKATADSLALATRLAATDSLAVGDSLAVSDSLAVAPADSLSRDGERPDAMSPVENGEYGGEPGELSDGEIPDGGVPEPEEITGPLDTTKIGFLTGTGHVRVYRSDMQAVCDSLEYCDLDSLARMYLSPIVWNEGNRQYTSDSLTVLVKNQHMERASLTSNAFIIIQETDICFDQIKGTEIMAYFDSTTVLERFDALGGASALFYLKENDEFATVNKVESKMLSAVFTNGEIDSIFYFDSPKNDAYPVVQLPKEEREMKGFNWQPELRPFGPASISTITLRCSQRTYYDGIQRPLFVQTDVYFPGYMKSVYAELRRLEAERRQRQIDRQNAEALAAMQVDTVAVADSLELAYLDAVADSLGASVAGADSLTAVPGGAVADSLAAAGGIAADSLGVTNGIVADSLGISADSVAVPKGPTPEQIKAAKEAARKQKLAEREEKRLARKAAKEARWAELDARDAAKAARKEAKALEKKRKSTLKMVIAAEKKNQRDSEILGRYVLRLQKKKMRQEGRAE